MLPKEPNNIQINRLRLIHLYEADYNLVLKFFWPHIATKCVDKLGLLGETNRVLNVYAAQSNLR